MLLKSFCWAKANTLSSWDMNSFPSHWVTPNMVMKRNSTLSVDDKGRLIDVYGSEVDGVKEEPCECPTCPSLKMMSALVDGATSNFLKIDESQVDILSMISELDQEYKRLRDLTKWQRSIIEAMEREMKNLKTKS